MSKRVSQVLEFVTEQTCTLLLCSLIPGVSPFKFLGQPFLGFWETHSFPFLEQTFSTGQTGWSLPTPLLDFTLLCWELVPSGSSQNRRFSVQREAWWGDQAHRTWNLLYSTDFLWNIDIWAKAEQRWVFLPEIFCSPRLLKQKRFRPLCGRNFWRFFYFLLSLNRNKKLPKWTFPLYIKGCFFMERESLSCPLCHFLHLKGFRNLCAVFSSGLRTTWDTCMTCFISVFGCYQ